MKTGYQSNHYKDHKLFSTVFFPICLQYWDLLLYSYYQESWFSAGTFYHLCYVSACELYLSMIPSFDGVCQTSHNKALNTFWHELESHWLLRQYLVFQPCSIPYRLVIRSFDCFSTDFQTFAESTKLRSMFSLQSNDQSVKVVWWENLVCLCTLTCTVYSGNLTFHDYFRQGLPLLQVKGQVGSREFCKDTSRSPRPDGKENQHLENVSVKPSVQ